MKTNFILPLVAASSVLLAGCFGGDSNSKTSVRVVHASSDAPAVNVGVDGDTVVSGADYKQAAVLKPDAGTTSIAVDGILPGGNTTTVIDTDASLRFDIRYDVIAVGKVGDQTIEPLILTDDGARDSEDSVRLRVAHLSPDAQDAVGGPVEVYLTAAGDPLPAEASFSFSFKESVGPIEVPAGDYQVRVAIPGNPPTVVFNSGRLPLSAGSDLLIGAVDNTVFGSAPISLLVVNGSNTTEILDADTDAGVRAVHNSASPTPAVDIYLNEDPDGTPAASNIAFGETVPTAATTGAYVPLSTGDNRIVVTATTVTSSSVIDATLDFANGDIRTVVAAGTLADGIDALVFNDNNRRIATEARLRVIHGAVEAPSVDVFVVPTASGGAGATLIGNSTPVLDNFAYGTDSGYLGVAEGDYVVFITSDDGATELYKSPSLALDAGGVYTAVARKNDAGGSVATVTLLDDFVAP
ncbi:hypothetical protein MSNKSG1_01533 [Marinobacter santoriniensis NKSG1]|uniref:DUF4397 domain-containing protein n=1 Tax=Marinobacter santoriniensis NKSG1 TaxID=1288826 RepID=M7D966_9GAMM|nr:DUF4397 domain-containing protein [Marinobacter santoriniensis]EMP57263.1 hypothetical protein MSNKSG1_01533 [Marinobacter santoriniensis NKSG1]